MNQCLEVLREKQGPPEDMTIQISYWLGYSDKPREWFLENFTEDGKPMDKQWRHDANQTIGTRGDANIKLLLPAIRQCKLPLHMKIMYCNLHERELLQLVQAFGSNQHILGCSIFGNPGNDSEHVQRALHQLVLRRKLQFQMWNNVPLTHELLEERKKVQEKKVCVLT